MPAGVVTSKLPGCGSQEVAVHKELDSPRPHTLEQLLQINVAAAARRRG